MCLFIFFNLNLEWAWQKTANKTFLCFPSITSALLLPNPIHFVSSITWRHLFHCSLTRRHSRHVVICPFYSLKNQQQQNHPHRWLRWRAQLISDITNTTGDGLRYITLLLLLLQIKFFIREFQRKKRKNIKAHFPSNCYNGKCVKTSKLVKIIQILWNLSKGLRLFLASIV